MSELFDKLFESYIAFEPDFVEMDRAVVEEISIAVDSCKDRLTQEQMEELKDRLFALSGTGEKGGFLLGAKYTMKVLHYLLSD